MQEKNFSEDIVKDLSSDLQVTQNGFVYSII